MPNDSSYQGRSLCFPTLQRPEPQQRKRREWLPVAAATLSVSAASEAAPAKSPIHVVATPKRVEMERQLRERAGLADESDKSRRNRRCALVVPHGGRGSRGRHAPPKDVLDRHIGEGFCCSLQHRRRGGASVGGQQREPIEQQVMRARRPGRLRKGPDGAADLQEVTLPRDGPAWTAANQAVR